MKLMNLECRFDKRNSFYGKAKVFQTNDKLELYSYDIKVAEIKGNLLNVFNLESQTTRRHVKEFALQNGFKWEKVKMGLNVR